MEEEYNCPVCGSAIEGRKGESEICETCRWEDCGLQERRPDLSGGANDMSFNQAKEYWEKHKKPLRQRTKAMSTQGVQKIDISRCKRGVCYDD